MWKNLTIVIALATFPTVALADKHKDAAKAQVNADKARDSAAKHAAKGNDSASKNMQKVAEQRQKAADRHAAGAARDDKKKRK